MRQFPEMGYNPERLSSSAFRKRGLDILPYNQGVSRDGLLTSSGLTGVASRREVF